MIASIKSYTKLEIQLSYSELYLYREVYQVVGRNRKKIIFHGIVGNESKLLKRIKKLGFKTRIIFLSQSQIKLMKQFGKVPFHLFIWQSI